MSSSRREERSQGDSEGKITGGLTYKGDILTSHLRSSMRYEEDQDPVSDLLRNPTLVPFITYGSVFGFTLLDFAHFFKRSAATNKMILATDSKSLFFLHLAALVPKGLKNVCMAFRNYCEEMDHEGCLTCLQQLKQEYFLVKNKLETLFKLEQQIVAAGGSIPMMW
ncbi:hypothetical protein ZIOFF_043091 [Zingiber officinale]|uniref:Histidine-containing phosphotransfer protein n=1 Tax=Zingiber officinale TaxID=94328 RepID=A0A8J5KW13_ZINOF|nr:hypothetical protein ZIOFF_043091 [Zingiber officinale]